MKLKTWMKSALAVGALMSLTTGALADGMLRYATVGEPPSLDQQVVTSDLATTIAHHMFEGLYTFNGSNAPVPLLASGETVSEDGKTIVIGLRKGVQFHNGQAMTSADVLASLQRWGEFGSRGSLIFDHVDSVEATGDYEITLKLKEPFGPWKNLMAFINGGPAIYPASVVTGATKEPIAPENYIGTGPYKFNAWEANRYVELVSFDGYASPDGKADGYGGARVADFDTLRFIPVPDVGTRVAGVRAGDYDYAESIPGDLFAELDADAGVKTMLNGGPIFGLVFLNSSDGPLKENFALRRAIQTAIDPPYKSRLALKAYGVQMDRSPLKAAFGPRLLVQKTTAKGTPKPPSQWQQRPAMMVNRSSLWSQPTIRSIMTVRLFTPNNLRRLDLILTYKSMIGRP